MSIGEIESEELPDLTSWDDLNDEVEKRDGVLRVRMTTIKRIAGETTLKRLICTRIESDLANVGLAHIPPDLPHSQGQHLVLFKAGSPAAAVIRAMKDGSASAAAEDALRRLNTSTDAIEVQALSRQVQEARDQATAIVDAVANLRGTLSPDTL
ncbi:hypothetical protein [Kitasatospora sp. NPDC057198]|uniref:hypothetical protein n=1 Tax=Kitasatospora sp. NPDC057198 TaxID=3346046 RepID=UPI003630547B